MGNYLYTFKKEKMTAVIIGRFQVPKLHPGHLYIIGESLQLFDKVVILLGTTTTKDERNPYGMFQRTEMIRKVFPHVQIDVVIDNQSDERWSIDIDTIVGTLKVGDPILVHSRDSFKDHYSGVYPLHELPELPGYSGTELRKQT